MTFWILETTRHAASVSLLACLLFAGTFTASLAVGQGEQGGWG